MWSRSFDGLQVDASGFERVIQKLLLREHLHIWVYHRSHGDAVETSSIAQIVVYQVPFSLSGRAGLKNIVLGNDQFLRSLVSNAGLPLSARCFVLHSSCSERAQEFLLVVRPLRLSELVTLLETKLQFGR